MAFVRLYVRQATVHDVKYRGAALDNFCRSVDIEWRKKSADNNDKSAGCKTPRDRGETTE